MTFTLISVKVFPESAVGFTLQSRLRQEAVDFYLALVSAVGFTLQSRMLLKLLIFNLAFSKIYP